VSQRIALTLSGGGFRATLFHLGVVRCLFDAHLLPRVRRVCSVSGGSILAAHLVLNWEKYTGSREAFEEAASEILQFVGQDLRGRILRRWVFGWLTLLPRFLSSDWSRIGLLVSHYDALYKGATLATLAASAQVRRPELQILTTSMKNGRVCSFDSAGFWCEGRKASDADPADTDLSASLADEPFSDHTEPSEPERVEAGALPLAFAVAASSAFPPLFPPALLEKGAVGELSYWLGHALTDGGVFDNLGIHRMRALQTTSTDQDDIVLLSDAGGVFDWSINNRFRSIVPRTIRTTDILMKRVTDLECSQWRQAASASPKYYRCKIDPPVLYKGPWVLPDVVQKKARMIRTDLDCFSSEEIHVLLRHGYNAANDALREVIAEPPAGGHTPTTLPVWPPLSDRSDPGKLNSAISRSGRRKTGLWSRRDPVYSVLNSWLLGAYLALPVLLLWALWVGVSKSSNVVPSPTVPAKPEVLRLATFDMIDPSKDRLIGDNDLLFQGVASLTEEATKATRAGRIKAHGLVRGTSERFGKATQGRPTTQFKVLLRYAHTDYDLSGFGFLVHNVSGKDYYELLSPRVATPEGSGRRALVFTVRESAPEDYLLLLCLWEKKTRGPFPDNKLGEFEFLIADP
jgi:predicted acylesterase/phospholipase RssA